MIAIKAIIERDALGALGRLGNGKNVDDQREANDKALRLLREAIEKAKTLKSGNTSETLDALLCNLEELGAELSSRQQANEQLEWGRMLYRVFTEFIKHLIEEYDLTQVFEKLLGPP